MISPLSNQVLRDHAQRPGVLFYDVDVLGAMYVGEAEKQPDLAYTELVSNGLMESAGVVVNYFAAIKGLYRITPLGRQKADELSAACRA